MGLFKLFTHRRKKNEINEVQPAQEKRKKEARKATRLNTQAERIDYIRENCDTYLESSRQMEEAKVEYQAVTSYLTDMQKIDMIPLEQRGALEEAASNIISLTGERAKLRNKSSILPDNQYRLFEQYELQIPKEMPEIKKAEEYQVVIEKDISQLEKARIKINNEQEDIIGKQSFLKGIAIVICFAIVFLFTLFAILSYSSKVDYTIPFIMTVIMGMVSVYYIITEARKNQTGIKLVQAKQNRQITLMNKVKIKSVNNQNYLDYTYNKYMVENYEQLQILWTEYLRVREEARKYQKNTASLEFYNNAMIDELKRFDIADAEIWIFQPTAIIDNKEMVEVRHRLNVRRQKLRERIDLNIRQKEDAVSDIQKTMMSYPDCREEGEKLLRKYRIDTMELERLQ
jgi:hypothetical protein